MNMNVKMRELGTDTSLRRIREIAGRRDFRAEIARARGDNHGW